MYNEKDAQKALTQWADGVINIGKCKENRGVLVKTASEFLDNLYAYNESVVLFKPTKTSQIPFRNSKEGALSYFIGGNSAYPEDHGFALNSWKRINFENTTCIFEENRIIVMGHYIFIDVNNTRVKAEFTFGFKKYGATLKIDLHHSSLPYYHK